jgi:hypothetical protein
MEIKLIKDWKRKGGKVVKKNTTLIVTNDLARSLIKNKIAKQQRDGLVSLMNAIGKKKEPVAESKQGYRKSKKKTNFNKEED